MCLALLGFAGLHSDCEMVIRGTNTARLRRRIRRTLGKVRTASSGAVVLTPPRITAVPPTAASSRPTTATPTPACALPGLRSGLPP